MVVEVVSEDPVMHWYLPSPDIIVVDASPVTFQFASKPPFKYTPFLRVITEGRR